MCIAISLAAGLCKGLNCCSVASTTPGGACRSAEPTEETVQWKNSRAGQPIDGVGAMQLPQAQAGPTTLWHQPTPAAFDAKWQVSAAQARASTADDACVVLYHQTSPSNAAAILRHGSMKLGPGYPACHGGRGVYLAADPQVGVPASSVPQSMDCNNRLLTLSAPQPWPLPD